MRGRYPYPGTTASGVLTRLNSGPATFATADHKRHAFTLCEEGMATYDGSVFTITDKGRDHLNKEKSDA